MQQSINFKELSNYLQPYLLNILTEYVSGGELQGREYKAASIYGGRGSSFSFNVDTQKWADFNGGSQAGGDIISLVASVKSIKQFEAAKLLAEQYGYMIDNSSRHNIPSGVHNKLGKPSDRYVYKNVLNQPTHIVFRYHLDEFNSKGKQKKTFAQWHFNEPKNKWVPKGTESTPLYKLDLLHAFPDKVVVICEGEKAADAAQKLLGDTKYVTTCWMGGSAERAIKKTDFSPLSNRDIILWSDADHDGTGVKAMSYVSRLTSGHVKTLKLIIPKQSDPDSFDAADMLELGLSNPEIDQWLQDRTEQIKPSNMTPVKIESTVSPQTFDESPNLTGVASRIKEMPGIQVYSDTLPAADSARAISIWQEYGLTMKSQFKVFENEANVIEVLKREPLFKDAFYFDTFKQCFMTRFDSIDPVPVGKDMITKIKIFLQKRFYFGNISTESVKNAISLHLSRSMRINSLGNVISNYTWDETPRINDFMHVILGAEKTDYTTAVSRIFWLQMVKRIIDPGSKADIMVILEGEQGIKKSTVLEIIGGDYFSVAGTDVSNKDFYIKLKGKFLMEMGELNTFSKSDHNYLKEVMSTRIDNFRDLFQPEDTPHPRTCVFVGTTNDKYYLKDETGNRRYLPVECTKINTDLLKQDLQQYFAEAYHRLMAGEDHWEFPKEAHEEITKARAYDLKDQDPWFEAVENWCRGKSTINPSHFFTDVAGGFSGGLGMDLDRVETRHSKRVWSILRQLGYKSRLTKIGSNKPFRIWSLDETAKEIDKNIVKNAPTRWPIPGIDDN